MSFNKTVSVLVALLFLAAGAAAQDVADLDGVETQPVSGDYVMGEEIETTFDYSLTEITRTRAIETILVIDKSGSMGGSKMSNVRTAAKNYVDNINVNAGDKIGVVAFDNSASKIHGLSSNKGSVKNAISGLNGNGGTDIGDGISQADFYSNSDAVKAMVVLSDGIDYSFDGGEADNARSNGIQVHGIMYGSGASESDMQEVSGSNCITDSNQENSDGDTCWYATTSSIDSVYNSINNEIKKEASGVKIHAVIENAEVPQSEYISKNGNEYVLSAASETGDHEKTISWYLAESGDDVTVQTGNSWLEYRVDGNQETETFPGGTQEENNVEYMNLDVTSSSINKDASGVDASVEVENTGNHPTPQTDVSFFADSRGNGVQRSIGSLQPGQSETVQVSGLSPSDFQVSSSTETVDVLADWQDDVIEPDESDNREQVGRIDIGAPSTSDDYSGNNWHTNPQTVNLQCSDSHSGKTTGCSQIDWQIEKNGNTVRQGTGTGTQTSVNAGSSAEGVLTVRYRGWDNAGNSEGWNQVTVKVDKTDPQTDDSTDNNWHSTSQDVTLSATDSVSGVDTIYYCTDQSNNCDPQNGNTYSGEFTVSQEGTNYVRYRSQDVAGNLEQVRSTEVKIDYTAPDTTDDYPGGWHNRSITVKMNCDDRPQGDNSGCNFIEACKDRGNTCSLSQTDSVTFDTEGRNYLRYRSTDKVGNEEARESTMVKLDFSDPTATVDKKILADGSLNATAVCSDSLSGCDDDSRRLYITDEATFDCPEEVSQYQSGASVNVEKERWVCSAVKDNAGHWDTSYEPVKFGASTITATVHLPGDSKIVHTTNDSVVPMSIDLGTKKQQETDVRVQLTNVNAQFGQEGESKEVTLDSEEQKELEFTVNPHHQGEKDLKILMTDLEEDTTYQRDVKINVREGEQRGSYRKEVPGIGLTHILLLATVSMTFFLYRP